ncbi:MAG: hypothetical protein IJO64_02570 [Clostridia bacterium]|nr:hypothetical protein [Clostridia bacterium]MBQ9847923.1 hypothetical protein [Clostridia bacterium]
MYSRDFGGIKSEGQLYNLEREYNESRAREREYGDEREHRERERSAEPPSEKPKGLRLDFLRELRLDDLILIGIGLLLLLDSEEENDIFVFLIALLLMF